MNKILSSLKVPDRSSIGCQRLYSNRIKFFQSPAANLDRPQQQLHVKNRFLNGDLKEEA